MASETLHFENARVAQQLYNNDSKNLQAIEQQLGVKATSREDWIKLEGDTTAIDRSGIALKLDPVFARRRFDAQLLFDRLKVFGVVVVELLGDPGVFEMQRFARHRQPKNEGSAQL